MEDYKLFNQIQNTLDPTVDDVVTHCETVKELWEYLEFLYANKKDVSHLHMLLLRIYRAEQKNRSLLQYYTEVKQTYEEENNMFPIVSDVKQMQAQKERVVVQCFLAGLGTEYDVARTQLLTSGTLPSFVEVYSRLLNVRKDGVMASGPLSSNSVALVSNASQDRRGADTTISRGNHSSPRTCYHCGGEGHVKKNCWRLHGKPPQYSGWNITRRSANVATQGGIVPNPSSVTVSADEYARFLQLSAIYDAEQPSTFSSALADRGF
ncbi:uncharacterized protein [Euphorbia lathyris]|uniref:uncharacterized protein isoform X1 n=1 Tax=Euphorbia lathyris TaxID=212925 RepID=UPI0033131562